MTIVKAVHKKDKKTKKEKKKNLRWHKDFSWNELNWESNALQVMKFNQLTVPSSIFNNACWTPSPETSLLIFRLSAWKEEYQLQGLRWYSRSWCRKKMVNWRNTKNLLCYLVNFIDVNHPLLSCLYIEFCCLNQYEVCINISCS